MRRKSDHVLEKVTINLVEGDYERLQGLFPRKGAGGAIREMVHNYLAAIDAKRKVEEESDG